MPLPRVRLSRLWVKVWLRSGAGLAATATRLLCVMAAALITLPLSLIPFAPVAPGLAIVRCGLGMTARDGLWLCVGVLLTGAALLSALPLLS